MKAALLVFLAAISIFAFRGCAETKHKTKLKSKQTKSRLYVNEEKMIYILMRIENPKNIPFLVGDKHLRNKAMGPLQIRLPCLSDVNWIVGRNAMKKKWGKSRLTTKDMHDFKKARWVAIEYLHHWGEQYVQKTKKIPTYEIYGRIFNGGPEGWDNWKTRCYAYAVKQYAREYDSRNNIS